MTPADQAFNVGEALARMAEEEYSKARDIELAGYLSTILRPRIVAEIADKEAAERRDIAFIYAWWSAQILEGIGCRCRWPHHCPQDGPSLMAWLLGRHEPREYLPTYPMPSWESVPGRLDALGAFQQVDRGAYK
jgi:hypothetical protein